MYQRQTCWYYQTNFNFYDQKDIFKPMKTKKNGYRYYSYK
ncbi:hypothetical protein HMPREF9209_0996 [Lactobacillus gasseri 224-1]|uniref:HTH merR-type domain-containing protein n=1 Tax=Lactobacillus gasseri 224-1 TaxID=679196 RepID=D1YJ90_LACGS|nr:hypothetical protein HMPREF9209_0996 [Lactobacillus gasseri 224-1]